MMQETITIGVIFASNSVPGGAATENPPAGIVNQREKKKKKKKKLGSDKKAYPQKLSTKDFISTQKFKSWTPSYQGR